MIYHGAYPQYIAKKIKKVLAKTKKSAIISFVDREKHAERKWFLVYRRQKEEGGS